MKDGHVHTELSAYLDGEAKDPVSIQRHLQTCPECARRHLEMLKISARLRALPAPECPPNFTEKVLARLTDAPVPRSGWQPAFALAAAGLVLAFGLLWIRHPDVFDAKDPAAPSIETAKSRAMDELAAQLALEMDIGFFEDEVDFSDEPGATLTYEQAALLLAQTASHGSEDELGSETDSFESIETLTREQMDALADELETYLEEG